MTSPIWWAVARTDEINREKPVNVDIADQPVVLWRDKDGAARALEDRCPHRRAPLSLGCILGNGAIQCGYHGWTYDGSNGQLIDIPNLKSTRKFPPVYRAKAFGVTESGGFIRVCLDAKAKPPTDEVETLPLSGTQNVALSHEEYINALFDDPGLLLKIKHVRFTPYLMNELTEVDGRLVLERSCQWSTPHWPAPFSSDFPLTLKISTDPASGESELLLRDDQFNQILRVLFAPVPAARGVTQVRWRAKLEAHRPGVAAKLMGLGSPFHVHSHIDGSALRTLKPSASIQAAELRRAMTESMEASSGTA